MENMRKLLLGLALLSLAIYGCSSPEKKTEVEEKPKKQKGPEIFDATAFMEDLATAFKGKDTVKIIDLIHPAAQQKSAQNIETVAAQGGWGEIDFYGARFIAYTQIFPYNSAKIFAKGMEKDIADIEALSGIIAQSEGRGGDGVREDLYWLGEKDFYNGYAIIYWKDDEFFLIHASELTRKHLERMDGQFNRDGIFVPERPEQEGFLIEDAEGA